jgi:hypothetical protein
LFKKALFQFYVSRDLSESYWDNPQLTVGHTDKGFGLDLPLIHPEYDKTGWFVVDFPPNVQFHAKGLLSIRPLSSAQSEQHSRKAVEIEVPDLARFMVGAKRSWLPD